MSISLDDLNRTHVPADIFTDRWIFQLAEEFRGPHAGAMFDEGRATEPVDFRVFRKFVVNYGASMVGAIRVVGEPAELGDCSGLRKHTGLPEPKAAAVEETAESADEDDEPRNAQSQRPVAHKGKHK